MCMGIFFFICNANYHTGLIFLFFSPYVWKWELRRVHIGRNRQPTIAADQHVEAAMPNLRYVQLISLLISCFDVSLSSTSDLSDVQSVCL